MCEAFSQLMDKGRELLQSYGKSQEETADAIIQKFSLDSLKTANYMKKYWQ